MSERYGECKLCRGHGKRFNFEIRDGEAVQVEIECSRCDGTGFSGAAEDRDE